MFDCPEYHSSFSILENSRHELLTDKLAIHFFQLRKINNDYDIADKKKLWMQFINADSKEDFDMLEKLNVPIIKEGITRIYGLSEDDRVQEEIRIREKSIRDYNSAMNNARTEGRAEGRAEGINSVISKMKALGMSEQQVNEILNTSI